ncbi:MAG: tyrosine-type recombinase/integrase [Chitinophagaceae bacterium]
MDKKIFFHNGIYYKIIKGKRNYIEYSIPIRNTNYSKRKRIYTGLSEFDNIEDLYEHAVLILENGFCEPKTKKENELISYLYRHQWRFRSRTFTQFKGIAKRLINWCEHSKIVAHKIQYNDALSYINFLSTKMHSNSVAASLTAINAIYNGMLKEKVILENPFSKIPKIKRQSVSLMYFHEPQIVAIKNYFLKNNPQMWVAIQLLYACFIRPAEMRLLTLYDINLEDSYILIRSEIAKNKKTQKVIIPHFILNGLKFIKNYPMHYYLIGKNGVPGEKPVGVNFFNKAHKTALRDLKIKGRYGFYSWKHTGVTMAVKCGINIKDLQLQLRHSSLEMVNEYLKNLGVMDSEAIKNYFPAI